jgi:hypothetical protein
MTAFKEYLLARLQEKSTWLGLIAIAGAFGVALSPDQATAIATAGTALAGAVAAGTRG